MGCILKITGDIDREAFLRGSDLSQCSGCMMNETHTLQEQLRWTTIFILVSRAPDLDEQIKDAVSFMEQRSLALKAIPQSPGVKQVRIIFRVEAGDVYREQQRLPNEVLILLSRLGIEPILDFLG